MLKLVSNNVRVDSENRVDCAQKKASYIKRTAEVLAAKFNGDLPDSVEQLCKWCPGVGPKMATLAVNIAWERTAGIGISFIND